jgi:hypothetical protein
MLSNGYRYYYSQLDAPMQSAYEAMLAGVKNYADAILLNPSFTLYESAISELVRAVKLDNPSVFYLASQYQYSIDGNAIWYQPQYLFDRAALQMMEVQMLNMVDNIVNTAIGWSMTDYDKELALQPTANGNKTRRKSFTPLTARWLTGKLFAQALPMR